MHRVMLFLGMGAAVLASAACGATPSRPLAAAAAANAADAVRRLLAEGRGADETDDSGITPLMWAARDNALAAMDVLLDRGADVNARDARNRWTPLLHATHTQRPAAVRLLLERGADPNLSAPRNLAPLLMAADDPNPEIVALLLAHGANPRVEGPAGITPLTQAVSGGALTDLTDRPLLGGCRPATVRALLDHDPTLRIPETFAGRQALWWARFHGCAEVLTLVGEAPKGLAHQAVTGIGLVRDEAARLAGKAEETTKK